MSKKVNQNQITIDLAKQHIIDDRHSDILKNDIKKLIAIIENEK